jgi:hypothetical protein
LCAVLLGVLSPFSSILPPLSFPCSKLLQKRKPDGTVLETHGEEEAAGKKCVKDRTNFSDFHLRGNRNVCTDNKTGQFSKGKAKPDQFEGVNGSMMEKLAVVPLPGLPIHTHEQILVTTPCAKFVSNVENNSMDMKASTKKTISVSKKKATHTTDRNEKFCGMILDAFLSLAHMCLCVGYIVCTYVC